MKGKFVYSNDRNATKLFGLRFWPRCSKKRLMFTLKGKTTCIKAFFISTKEIKEEKMEVEVNWTKMDLSSEGLLAYSVIDLSNLFEGCKLLEHVDLDFNGLDGVKEIKLEAMFKDCGCLRKLNIAKFSQDIADMSSMFLNCSSLEVLPDISNWNIEEATDFGGVFGYCCSLISLPDISKWKTSKVINMEYMFYSCSSLVSLPDISKWNTENVENMSHMFSYCSSLKSLPDISKWKTINIKNISYMFEKCRNLKSFPKLKEWGCIKCH